MDDALSTRQLPNGQVEVGVHIADVSHFVQKVLCLSMIPKMAPIAHTNVLILPVLVRACSIALAAQGKQDMCTACAHAKCFTIVRTAVTVCAYTACACQMFRACYCTTAASSGLLSHLQAWSVSKPECCCKHVLYAVARWVYSISVGLAMKGTCLASNTCLQQRPRFNTDYQCCAKETECSGADTLQLHSSIDTADHA